MLAEIQTYTEPKQWLYVPTLENPADIGTRSILVEELRGQELCWGGPGFLRKKCLNGQGQRFTHKLMDLNWIHPYSSQQRAPSQQIGKETLKDWTQVIFSTGQLLNGLHACLRKWAYVFCIIRVTRGGSKFGSKLLFPSEVEDATNFLIRQAQQESLVKRPRCTQEKGDHLSWWKSSMQGRVRSWAFPLSLMKVGWWGTTQDSRTVTSMISKKHPGILDWKTDLARMHIPPLNIQWERMQWEEHLVVHTSLLVLGLSAITWDFGCNLSRCKGKSTQPKTSSIARMKTGRNLEAFPSRGHGFCWTIWAESLKRKAKKEGLVLVFTCMAIRAIHLDQPEAWMQYMFLMPFQDLQMSGMFPKQ